MRKEWAHPLAIVLSRIGRTQARMSEISAYPRKNHRSRSEQDCDGFLQIGPVDRTLVPTEFWVENENIAQVGSCHYNWTHMLT